MKKKNKNLQFNTNIVRRNDPLYIVFEKHLYDFNYDSREKFINGVVEDYLVYLAKQKVSVPPMWRRHLVDNLSDEVTDMLVRKIYGCLTIDEFKDKEEASKNIHSEKKIIRRLYQKLAG